MILHGQELLAHLIVDAPLGALPVTVLRLLQRGRHLVSHKVAHGHGVLHELFGYLGRAHRHVQVLVDAEDLFEDPVQLGRGRLRVAVEARERRHTTALVHAEALSLRVAPPSERHVRLRDDRRQTELVGQLIMIAPRQLGELVDVLAHGPGIRRQSDPTVDDAHRVRFEPRGTQGGEVLPRSLLPCRRLVVPQEVGVACALGLGDDELGECDVLRCAVEVEVLDERPHRLAGHADAELGECRARQKVTQHIAGLTDDARPQVGIVRD